MHTKTKLGYDRFSIFTIDEDGHYWPIASTASCSGTKEAEGNAEILAVAFNTCLSVNPEHPLNAAEALPELLEVCRIMLLLPANCIDDSWTSLKIKMEKLIAKATK